MKITVVTNVPAPYRDEVFEELAKDVELHVDFLARDEPRRGWRDRELRYPHRYLRSLSLPGTRPHYISLPAWLLSRGLLMVAGFGQPALFTVLFRPGSTLIWTEATIDSDGLPARSRLRQLLREFIARRAFACVAVGEESRRYCVALGANRVVELPNAHGLAATGHRPSGMRSGHASELVVAHIGDWSTAKGADWTSEVIERLRESGSPARLVIAGNIHDVALPPDATYLGYLPAADLWPVVRHHFPRYLLLLARTPDRWGFVVSEAMSLGIVPITTTRVGCVPDLVKPLDRRLVVSSTSDAVNAIMHFENHKNEYDRVSAAALDLSTERSPAWAKTKFMTQVAHLLHEAS